MGHVDQTLSLCLGELGTLVEQAGPDGKTILVDSPALFVGFKRYEPGEVFPNHFHEGYDEFFAGIEGSVSVWQGRSSRFELSPGTSMLCRRGTQHYLVNESSEPALILFAKIPMVQNDTVWVEWTPPGGNSAISTSTTTA